MPRIPKVHRLKRTGRKPYYQLRVGGKLHHLGIDPVEAHKQAAELIARHFGTHRGAGPPETVAGLCRAWLADNPDQWNGWILQTFIDYVTGLRPAAVRGQYLRGVAISATMTPSVRVAA